MESRHHIWLLSIAVLILSINANTTPSHSSLSDIDHHENLIDSHEHDAAAAPKKFKNDKFLELKFDDIDDENLNKLVPEKFKPKTTRKITTTTKDASAEKTTTKTASDEVVVKNKSTTKKVKIPLADDPRFNKMLPEKTKEHKDNHKKDTEADDSDYDNYDENYDEYYDQLYDESSAENKTKTATSTTKKPIDKQNIKLKPIKGDDKDIPKEKNNKKNDEDDEDDDDEEIEDEHDVVYASVPCPRDCICDRNLNSEKVATCSRLDADIQKFGQDITDLVVVDVGPKYPIILGPLFFQNIGLKNLNSLKISNCTLELLHPSAFHGLTELFAVNLTNVGITHIDPDTFVSNKRLRLLTISGNDLSSMTSQNTRTKYLIKSSSIEELDLSNNNFKEIQPTAFIHLPNIVYINLAYNELKTLPENLFNEVETIEDLDLSHNKIINLPPEIFKRTALARLDLKFNDIVGDLRFATVDLQELDLSYCSIKTINNHMFAKMTGLITLDLKGNGITKIQPDSFISLNYLRHIDLSYNNLDQISSMLFYKNPNLDVVKLNDNAKLSELPPDGFQSFTRVFNVYYLDISNCAINALGKTTFSQMPHITTLKLSWNNINNMHRDTFANLKQLTELDLSNNLIVKLDDNIFKSNKQISKLNLSGNPIRFITTKLFQSSTKLHELDVSDCELTNVLEHYNNQQIAFFDTLRVFNVSFNKIKKITEKNVNQFKNLKTFSIEGNLLKCNDEFRSFIKYLVTKGISSGKIIEKSILEIPAKLPAHTIQGWDDIVATICKRENEKIKNQIEKENENKFDDTDSDYDEESEDDDEVADDDDKKDEIFSPKKVTKEQGKKILDKLNEEEDEDDKKEQNNKTKNDVKKNNDDEDDDEDEDENEEEDNDEDEDSSKEENDDDDDDDEYDEEYDYDEDKKNNKQKENAAHNKPSIKDHGLTVEEVNVIKETNDKFLRGKLLPDEDLENDDDEEIIIERGHIYYDNYGFLKPILIMFIILVIILIVTLKIVSIIMRKRGERYRMAILASKNSIVYQKLSEDIPKMNHKNPKVHQYSRINQV